MYNVKDEVDLIINLLKIKGAENCSGEASLQVMLPLKDDTFMRIGVTDEDVAETQGLWVDYWEKIDGKLKLIK